MYFTFQDGMAYCGAEIKPKETIVSFIGFPHDVSSLNIASLLTAALI